MGLYNRLVKYGQQNRMIEILSFVKLLIPPHPQKEYHHIVKRPHNPFMPEVPVFGLVVEDHSKDDDAEDISEVHHEEGGGDVPEFVFPRAGVEEEEAQ